MVQHPPLFIVTGASGVGKSTVVPELQKLMPELLIFDIDAIYGYIEDTIVKTNVWLRIARSIAENGRLTVICGTSMPWDAEKCDDYTYFSQIYYLNLHCDDETREKRLRARNWSDEMIGNYKNFAKWLIDNADTAYNPPMPTVETTKSPPSTVAGQIKAWIQQYT